MCVRGECWEIALTCVRDECWEIALKCVGLMLEDCL